MTLELKTTRHLCPRRGFSFTEILFAVMILGIGFIMIAAMFPVAIRQTEATNQETIGASVGRGAFGYGEQIAGTLVFYKNPPKYIPQTSSILAPTFINTNSPTSGITVATGQPPVTIPGEVWSFNETAIGAAPLRDNYGDVYPVYSQSLTPGTTSYPHPQFLWNVASQNLFVPGDTRFGWVGMYKRDLIVSSPDPNAPPTASPYAQLIMIAVQAQSAQAFSLASDLTRSGSYPATLEPARLTGVITWSNTGSVITFNSSDPNLQRVGEGAYVVISDDGFQTGDPKHVFNGRIFRIGVPGTSATAWQLAPGNNLTASDISLLNTKPAAPNITAQVLVVGRPLDSKGNPTGGVQDVAAYSTFVQIPN